MISHQQQRLEALRVPATMRGAEAVVAYALHAAKAARLDDKATYRLRLAVDEVSSNIVQHAYCERQQEGDLIVTAEIALHAVTLILEDTGTRFDPREAQPPALDLSPAERAAGGLGVFLALWAADEHRYERVTNRNRNTFVVRRRREEQRPVPQRRPQPDYLPVTRQASYADELILR